MIQGLLGILEASTFEGAAIGQFFDLPGGVTDPDEI